jgi:hypothetical protein
MGEWLGRSWLWEVALLGVLLLVPRRLSRRLVPQRVRELAGTPARACALCVVASLAGCVAWALAVEWPEPAVHDEFSYLLAGDTLASFRLANPPPDLGEHFESFQILVRPAYASKYPLGQGAALALGFLLGDPAFGVWLSTAAACAALCWMLAGWMPLRAATWGALLLTSRFGAFGYWAQSFWGGSVAVLGGALVYGALPRLLRRGPDLRSALVLGSGLFILAHSRPWEGFAAALPAAIAISWKLVRMREGRSDWTVRVMVPAGSLAACALVTVGMHNSAVTGHALRFPHREHQDQYNLISQFVFGTPPAGQEYAHAVMRRHYKDTEKTLAEQRRGSAAFFRDFPRKIAEAARFPLGWLVLPAAVALARFRRPQLAPASAWLSVLLACSVLTFVNPHYAAPGLAAGSLLAVRGLRLLSARLPGRRLFAAAAVPALFAGSFFGNALEARSGSRAWGRLRAHFEERLESEDGRQLVLVSYGPRHSPDSEWVYNRADLERAEVVWARSIGTAEDARLRAAFPGHAAWVMTVDADWEEPVLRRLP